MNKKRIWKNKKHKKTVSKKLKRIVIFGGGKKRIMTLSQAEEAFASFKPITEEMRQKAKDDVKEYNIIWEDFFKKAN